MHMQDTNTKLETIHTAFYQFVSLDDPTDVADQLRHLCEPLLGSILVAHEGINGMLAGSPLQIEAFERALTASVFVGGKFQHIPFKRSPCKTTPFKKLKVHVKPEIVPLGIDGVDATKTGINVSPADWRELITQDDVVLLDNRNSFEYRLGHFDGAIDPGVTNFRDFPQYVTAHIDSWKRDGKKVAMYCTGGIRCEKTSAWMLDMDIPVYQLEGGILNYFKQMPDAERDWQGECFVFDNRVALDTKLNETDTSVDEVYAESPDETWRLARAKRLDEA
jgi:UPF0176 protein